MCAQVSRGTLARPPPTAEPCARSLPARRASPSRLAIPRSVISAPAHTRIILRVCSPLHPHP